MSTRIVKIHNQIKINNNNNSKMQHGGKLKRNNKARVVVAKLNDLN